MNSSTSKVALIELRAKLRSSRSKLGWRIRRINSQLGRSKSFCFKYSRSARIQTKSENV